MRRPAAALLALLPALALASGDSVPNVAARDLGIAQSLVAAQDGAGAVYVNPAALSRIRGLDLSITGAVIDNGTEWRRTVPAGALTDDSPASSVKSKFHPAPGPALFAAYGGTLGGRGWGVGVGMNVPEGGNVVWPDDWPGRYEILKVDRRVYAGYLNGGIEVLPRLRLGGGLVYLRTTESLRARFRQGTLDLGPATVDSAGSGFTYQLSGEFEILRDVLAVAVDYKHKAHQKLSGDVAFDLPPTQALLGQGVTHRFVVPNVLSAGVAYRPVPALLLAFQWNLDRYRVYQEDRFVGAAGTIPDVVVPRDYGNGYTLRGGAEYALSPSWAIRAGLLRDHTGQKAANFDPSLPDGDVWAGTAGASYHVPSLGLGIHAGVFYARYDEVDNTGLAARDPDTGRSELQGKWRSSALIASLGLTWRYGGSR